jgi:hypothetical protein
LAASASDRLRSGEVAGADPGEQVGDAGGVATNYGKRPVRPTTRYRSRRGEFDQTHFWLGGGETFLITRRERHIQDGDPKVSLAIEDVVSFDPFIARGSASTAAPTDRSQGPQPHCVIHPPSLLTAG